TSWSIGRARRRRAWCWRSACTAGGRISDPAPIWYRGRSVSATLRLPGLASPVGCVRDRFGLPHLHAETRAEVYRELGGEMAGDRFWHVDMEGASPWYGRVYDRSVSALC